MSFNNTTIDAKYTDTLAFLLNYNDATGMDGFVLEVFVDFAGAIGMIHISDGAKYNHHQMWQLYLDWKHHRTGKK